MPAKTNKKPEEPADEEDILFGSKPVDVPSKSVTAASGTGPPPPRPVGPSGNKGMSPSDKR